MQVTGASVSLSLSLSKREHLRRREVMQNTSKDLQEQFQQGLKS